MTSISAMMASLKIPSLADYLNNTQGSASSFTPTSYTATGAQSLAGILSSGDSSTDDGDTISLSPEAQAMLAQSGAATSTDGSTSSDSSGDTTVKAGAASFIGSFFEDNGIDLDDLSDDAQSLIKGLGDLIGNMGDVTQNSKLDSMTNSYSHGQRQSFTLQGTNEGLSASIQYANGKPSTLTVTQIQGGTASTATIKLGEDTNGKFSSIDIQRVQKQYNSFGGLTATDAADPLSLALYAS